LNQKTEVCSTWKCKITSC